MESDIKKSLLYIDDEKHSLTAFEANFRRDYHVHTATSAEEGKKILSENDIHVIIADQKMPQMTGVEFFESILKDYPQPIRMLLTGYSDIEAVINAINKAQVFRYMSKPWNQDELKKVIDQAFEVYELKEEKDEEVNFFLYRTSHDLKGPLDSLRGLLNITKEGMSSNSEYEQYIRLMDESVGRLNNILTELIEYKRVEKGILNRSEIQFTTFFQEVLRSLQHTERYADVSFQVNIQQKEPFYTDKSILRSILQNLTQNAIKYGGNINMNGQVIVDIDANKDNVKISVKDNGMGIEKENLKDIFNAFQRSTANRSGSGLGLYIVKLAVEKLNGKIDVASEINEGTTFTVELPNSNG